MRKSSGLDLLSVLYTDNKTDVFLFAILQDFCKVYL